MPRDVRTRWNSTYDMLSFAVMHEEELIKFTAEPFDELRGYRLDREDFKLIKDLSEVLFVSRTSATPTPTPADKLVTIELALLTSLPST